ALGRRRAGGRAGRVREGVRRARALPVGVSPPAVADADRGERIAQPAARGRTARGAGAAGGGGAAAGGGGPVPRGRSADRRAPARAARGRGRAARGGSPRDLLPLLPRPERARDRPGARLAGRDGEVAAVARAGPAARVPRR